LITGHRHAEQAGCLEGLRDLGHEPALTGARRMLGQAAGERGARHEIMVDAVAEGRFVTTCLLP
jgi:hypothetical protein